MGVALTAAPPGSTPDLVLAESAAAPCRPLSVRLQPVDAALDAQYTAARADVAERVAQHLPLPPVRLCVLLVWAGTKPPPSRMLEVAKSFLTGGAAAVLVFVENAHVAAMRAAAGGDARGGGVRVVNDVPHGGNLTRFLHDRVDELVPEVRGHAHYALGWGLCDFRWLFGDIFAPWIPEADFTHWAWADADAFASARMVFGPLTDHGRDFARHDVISFASFGTGRDFYATTMLAYTSGTFAAFRNTARGRTLYRHAPLDVLVKGLSKPNNQLLDEALVPNAVMGAPGVTAVLSTMQARNRNIVASVDGRLFYVAPNESEMADLLKLANAGRVLEPMAVASLGAALMKGRFNGGRPIAMQTQSEVHLADWMPRVDVADFEFNKGIGAGFASLLRDANGAWWHRPAPWRAIVFARGHGAGSLVSRLELAVAHVRQGRPCVVEDAWLRAVDAATGEERTRMVREAGRC